MARSEGEGVRASITSRRFGEEAQADDKES